jgi:hypothetical protein
MHRTQCLLPYTGNSRSEIRLDCRKTRSTLPRLGAPSRKNWIRDQGYMGPYTPKKNTFKKSQAGIYSNVDGSLDICH